VKNIPDELLDATAVIYFDTCTSISAEQLVFSWLSLLPKLSAGVSFFLSFPYVSSPIGHGRRSFLQMLESLHNSYVRAVQSSAWFHDPRWYRIH
jgi:hypothetical protein